MERAILSIAGLKLAIKGGWGGRGEEPLCDKLLAFLITVALSSELNMEHFLILTVAG
jgi:hypothetical protein